MQLKKYILNLLIISILIIILSDLATIINNKFEYGVILPDFSFLGVFLVLISFLFFIYIIKCKKRLFFLGLFVVGISMLYYNHSIAFKIVNTDSWAYLQFIRNATISIPPPPIDISRATDPHYGPQLLLEGYIFKYLSLDFKMIFYGFSIANFAMLITSLFLFIKEKYNKKIAIYTVISAFFVWGVYQTGYKSYSLTGIWHFYYNDTFSLAMLFFSLYFYIKEDKISYFIISIFFGFLCFSNHPITGFILILFVFCLSIEKIFNEKSIGIIKKFVIYSFFVFLLTYLWPYYNFLDAFSRVLEVRAPSVGDALYLGDLQSNISRLLSAVGPAFLGIFYLLKKRDFFIINLCFFGLVYFFLNLPFYRRFLIPIVFSMQLAFALFFYTYIKNYKNKNIFIITIVCFVSAFFILKPGITGFIYSEEKVPLDIDFLDEYILDKDSKILSDQMTEHLIRAKFGFETLSKGRVLENKELKDFFNLYIAKEDKIGILKNNSIDYILINKNIVENYLDILRELKDITIKLYEDENCVLLKVEFSY